MSGISLTASMRSNLLSLQNISGQVSSTQNKLATGNKVNSAIDNPSSYYTALSLNNRADDLNALLDSMGQAVSTIKAATTALESATEFLEQAKAVANQALEQAIPSKSFFEEKVGENGAVVTTAQELRDAINSGKETICVYGAIDLGDISTSGGLSLKENQKLVGVGYFGNYDTDTDKFSSISATAVTVGKDMITIEQNGSKISDLSLNYVNNAQSGTGRVVYINGKNQQNETVLCNLDTAIKFGNEASFSRVGIQAVTGSVVKLEGSLHFDASGSSNVVSLQISASKCELQTNAKLAVQLSGDNCKGMIINDYSEIQTKFNSQINIKTTGKNVNALNMQSSSSFDVGEKTKISFETSGHSGFGAYIQSSSIFNISRGALVNIKTNGINAHGILVEGGKCHIDEDAQVDILISETGGAGIYVLNGGICNILGNIEIVSPLSDGLWVQRGDNNQFNILSSAKIYFNVANQEISKSGNASTVLNIAKGAKLAFEKNGNINWYETKEDYLDKNNANIVTINADNVKGKLTVEETSAWELPEKAEIDWEDSNSSGETAKQDLTDAGRNYQEIINQYEALSKEASYKGINLLQNDKLSVKFNETNTADLSVQGKDMSSKALGFATFEWESQGDINKSIEELSSAINTIRNYSSELGNNYNIITTRQDFTESLVNVLTEGADKLTLADMNEESANMLALQTRQQLAINSLSLASQASQSILKLF